MTSECPSVGARDFKVFTKQTELMPASPSDHDHGQDTATFLMSKKASHALNNFGGHLRLTFSQSLSRYLGSFNLW